jgi:exonuclease SbcC
MRPERLEVAGFGIFREPVVIDFAGADLFALTGPTGAGKSTVIDAVVFALYGSVPRYDNKNLVAPVISQGKVEARVRLDFRVGDERYRIARVVRAAGKGASTREARFERVGEGATGSEAVEVLAGTADEVTAAVEQLLGLSYDHFTTCVVLPQGDFQRFLHQKPSGRQDLLVELLDLGIYEQMMKLAKARATAAANRRDYVTSELDKLAAYTPHQREVIETEIAELEKLVVVIDDALPAIDALTARSAAAAAEARAAAERADALAAVEVPDDVAELAERLRGATDVLDEARRHEERARAAVRAATGMLDGLGDRSALDAALRAHEARATEAGRVPRGEAKVAEAAGAEQAAVAALDAARTAHQAARTALEDARRSDRAREFAAHLVVGEPCPVCLQQVADVPEHAGADLARLAAAESEAAAALAEATAAQQSAAATSARFQGLLADVRARVAELDDQLAGQPDRAVIEATLATIDEATATLRDARREEDAAVGARAAFEQRLATITAEGQRSRRAFDRARDAVAALGPPAAERDDLAADWAALAAWAGEEHPRALDAARVAATEATEAEGEARRRRAELIDACAEAGVEVPAGRLARDVVVEQLSTTRADLESLDDILARVAQLRADDAELAETERVAGTLATHLRSTNFEKWVLDEVLQRLVAGATGILHELSAGTYSLTFDGRSNFCVIDHANADAVRSARTLSGGETFLVSLSLALALADEVASLAARGTVRLESIFLDEGFGTLDPDTLDTVATAIEELGARGRMVGLVTHVRDLAERLPLRFEVTREGNASTVARVDR